jgi:hypothetical protein
MLGNVRVRRCLAGFFAVVSLCCSGCATVTPPDETMAELGRLRAAVRQSEERMAAMQAHQHELSRQLAVLSVFVGTIANDAAARRDEMARKKENLAGNAAATVSIPAEPAVPIPPPPDLEF